MFELRVRDFGPIRQGAIRLRPLTVLIGANNVGKSYLALLAYALTGPYRRPGLGLRYAPPRWELWTGDGPETWLRLENSIAALLARTGSVAYQDLDQPAREAVRNIVQGFITQAAEVITREVKRCFASQLADLVRRAPAARLEFALHTDNPPTNLTFSLTRDELQVKSPPLDLSALRFGRRKRSEPPAIELSEFLHQRFPFFFSPSYYLPAARSGILQAHKALAAFFVARAPLVGVERIEVPNLSGVVADFIASLLRLDRRPGPRPELQDEAQFIEHEICGGSLNVRSHGLGFEYPEIYYRYGDLDIPLHRTSSMISELAPIVLALKYLRPTPEFLIIEEPEAHLHPDNQRRMAQALVRLVRRGVPVLITTHSDYLLEQISNFIRLAESSELRRQRGYNENEYLVPEEVSAYLLRSDDRGGSVVEELAVNPEEGISSDAFISVAEALHDETIALERAKGKL